MPKLREHLHTCHDIPVNIEDVIKEFSPYFENFDVSELDNYKDPKHYFIEDLNPELRDMFEPKIVEKAGDCIGTNAFDVICDYIKEVYPQRSESYRNTFERCQFYINTFYWGRRCDTAKCLHFVPFFILE